MLLSSNQPPYPAGARSRHLEGRVTVRVAVTAAGRVASAQVQQSSGHQILDSAALRAVRSWRFRPARRQGQPVAADALVRVRFVLD